MKNFITLTLFITFSSHSFAAYKMNEVNSPSKGISTPSLKVKLAKDNREFYESIHKYDNDWANQNNG